jgi:hypothetical protein
VAEISKSTDGPTIIADARIILIRETAPLPASVSAPFSRVTARAGLHRSDRTLRVRRVQWPTVNRSRTCLRCSISSTNARAKSSPEISELPSSFVTRTSPPIR